MHITVLILLYYPLYDIYLLATKDVFPLGIAGLIIVYLNISIKRIKDNVNAACDLISNKNPIFIIGSGTSYHSALYLNSMLDSGANPIITEIFK